MEDTAVEVRVLPEGGSVRERLMRAGIKSFAERGFHGARIEDIISHAGVNVRMVYHYFGSKEGLYDEAVRNVSWALLSESASAAKEEALPVLERLEVAVKAYCEACIENPSYARVLAWEATRGGETLKSVVPEDESPEHIFGSLLEEALKTRKITRQIDLTMSVAVLASAPSFLSHPLVQGSDPLEAGSRSKRVSQSFWTLVSGALGF